VTITVASFTEDQFHESRAHLVTDEHGRVQAEFETPSTETLLTIVAFENDPKLPPAERATAWACVEVRDDP
jgi:hypothetical protein